MSAWLDNVKFNPTAGGTTDWTVSGSVAGYQTPALAGAVNGRTYVYFALDTVANQWEIGSGAYNTTGPVLPRTAVLYNSSGTGTATGQSGAGTKINFTNTPIVAIVGVKEDLISIEEANSFTTAQKIQARTNINAAAGSGGWTIAVITSTNATWPVPAGTSEMMIEGWSGGSSGAGQAAGTQRGSGGGGGGYGFKYYNGTMDSTLNVTIGAGGASSVGGGGSAGGTTSIVGTNLGTLTLGGGSAPGGSGFSAGGGTGGAPSGAWTYSIPGGQGSATGPTTSPASGAYGLGGDAPRGGSGGKSNVGSAGNVPGGGGSGENQTGGGSGAGAAGEVIIWTR